MFHSWNCFVSLRFLSAETYTSDWTGWVSKLIFPFGKIWHEVYTENTRMFWEDNVFYLPTEAPRAKEKSNSTGIKLSTELVICNHLIFKQITWKRLPGCALLFFVNLHWLLIHRTRLPFGLRLWLWISIKRFFFLPGMNKI